MLLALMLAIFLVTLVNLYERTGWRSFSDEDRALVERTRRLQAALVGEPVPDSVPRVVGDRNRACVILRPGDGGDVGTYSACYERRTGELLEERLTLS